MIILISVSQILVMLIFLYAVGMIPSLLFLMDNHNSHDFRLHYPLSIFFGFTVISMVGRLAAISDLTIQYVAWPTMISFVFIDFIFLYTKRNQSIFSNFKSILPRPDFLIGMFVVVIVAGFGLISIGSFDYKGYGWWDLLYYGSQAEALRTIPLSEWQLLKYEKPYLAIATTFFSGIHRIGLGAFNAMLATILGIDGASSIGLSTLLSVILIYSGVYYVAAGYSKKSWQLTIVSVFCAVIPNNIITGLEGFISVSYFIGFSALFVRLFPHMLEEASYTKSVLGGLIVSSALMVLLDGLYLFLVMSMASAVWAVLSRKIDLRPAIKHLLILFLATILPNIPFYKEIFNELSSQMARTQLNSLYPFALSPSVLHWSLLGTLSFDKAPMLYTLASLCGFGVILLGVFGILYYMFIEGRGEAINAFILLLIPIYFASHIENYAYAFYKVFSFALPIIVLGSMSVPRLIGCGHGKATAVPLNKTKPSISFSNFLAFSVSVFVIGIMLVSFYMSVRRVSKLATAHRPESTISVSGYLNKYFTPENLQRFSSLNAAKDKNILLIAPEWDMFYWWSAYYARNNDVYLLHPESNSQYLPDFEKYKLQISSKKAFQAMIVSSPAIRNLFGNEIDNKIAMLKAQIGETKVLIDNVPSSISASVYEIFIFSNESADCTIELKLAPQTPAIAMVIGNEIVMIDSSKYQLIHFPMKVGYQTVEVRSLDNINFSIDSLILRSNQ